MTKNGEQTGDIVRVSTNDGNLWGLFINWSRGVLMGGTNLTLFSDWVCHHEYNTLSVPPVHPWGWI